MFWIIVLFVCHVLRGMLVRAKIQRGYISKIFSFVSDVVHV